MILQNKNKPKCMRIYKENLQEIEESYHRMQTLKKNLTMLQIYEIRNKEIRGDSKNKGKMNCMKALYSS